MDQAEIRVSRVALTGAPAIAALLVASWWLPLASWSLALVGVIATAVFSWVVVLNRARGRRLLAQPAVVACLAMYAIALFALAFGSIALKQPGAITTDGAAHVRSLGVVALLATAMGIAGGEVGAQVHYGARVIAHVQLLLVVGAVAGVGTQILRGITNGPGATPQTPEPAPSPPSPTMDLYRKVYDRLLESGGEAALDEAQVVDRVRRQALKESLARLPLPSVASESEALEVFDRIDKRDLERFYSLRFGSQSLGETVRAFLRGGSVG